MAANTNPIFTGTPHIGKVTIPQATACAKSDGSSSASGNEKMYCVFKAGVNGSFLGKIRFCLGAASASITATASCLRMFLTTVSQTEGSSSAATTTSDTHLLAEVASSSLIANQPTTSNAYYEVVFNMPLQTGISVLVTQHVAMANACTWEALAFGGDY